MRFRYAAILSICLHGTTLVLLEAMRTVDSDSTNVEFSVNHGLTITVASVESLAGNGRETSVSSTFAAPPIPLTPLESTAVERRLEISELHENLDSVQVARNATDIEPIERIAADRPNSPPVASPHGQLAGRRTLATVEAAHEVARGIQRRTPPDVDISNLDTSVAELPSKSALPATSESTSLKPAAVSQRSRAESKASEATPREVVERIAPTEVSVALPMPVELTKRPVESELPKEASARRQSEVVRKDPVREPATAGGVPQVASVAQVGASVDETPRKLPANVPPTYPIAALRSGIEGVVTIQVRIEADGRVSSAWVSESSRSDLLDAAALDAVLQWRFSPAKRSGRAVPHEVLLPVRFTIRRS